MPNLPDIPGKDIIGGTTRRVRGIAVSTGAGVLAVGGFVVKRVLAARGDDRAEDGALADRVSPIPKPPPSAKPAPKPKAAKPAKPANRGASSS